MALADKIITIKKDNGASNSEVGDLSQRLRKTSITPTQQETHRNFNRFQECR